MRWANKVHRELEKERRENEKTVEHGQIFYDVMITAVCRAWRHGMLRANSDPEPFALEMVREMARIFEKPCNYHEQCIEETGIEVDMK